MHDSRAVAQDVHRLQHELRSEQDAAKLRIDETKRTVDHVTAIVEETAERLTEAGTDAASRTAGSPTRVHLADAMMRRFGAAAAAHGVRARRPESSGVAAISGLVSRAANPRCGRPGHRWPGRM